MHAEFLARTMNNIVISGIMRGRKWRSINKRAPGLCVGGRQIDKRTCSAYGRQNTGKIQKE